MIQPGQCRAARGLLKWTQEKLAAEAGLGLSSVKGFEGEQKRTYPRNRVAIQTTLESAGIEFIPENGGGPGVRLRK